jgi:hypothetical protein
VGSVALGAAGAQAAPGANVIDHLVPAADADAGNGWASDPSNPGGNGVEQLVEGPGTPPSGRGSIELTTPSSADRAQIHTNPAGLAPSPWASLVGASFSTFTFDTVNTGASLSTLRFAGFQNGATGFTTLTFAPSGNGVPVVGQWQDWTLGDTSQVFQSNQTDGFCTQAAPCTFAQFVQQYPSGVWGQVQLGLGSGAPAGARGFADALSLVHGTTAYSWDFEVPASSNSTATVRQGAQTQAGGQAVVTLTASPVAAASVTFSIVSTLPDGSTRTTSAVVAAGQTEAVNVDVPFGTTNISVTAQGTRLVTGPVTFTEPSASTPPAVQEPVSELADTGSSVVPISLALGALASGGLALTLARLMERKRMRQGE